MCKGIEKNSDLQSIWKQAFVKNTFIYLRVWKPIKCLLSCTYRHCWEVKKSILDNKGMNAVLLRILFVSWPHRRTPFLFCTCYRSQYKRQRWDAIAGVTLYLLKNRTFQMDSWKNVLTKGIVPIVNAMIISCWYKDCQSFSHGDWWAAQRI